MLLSEVLRLERPLIGLDTETTGTNPALSRIVELALEIYRPDGTVKEWRTLVNPGIPIPPGATKVHHITDRHVQACRVCEGDSVKTYADVKHCTCETFMPWPTFAQIADGLLKGFCDADFTGYNVRFDLRMLAAEFKRNKKAWDYEDARVIDAFRLWQIAEGRSLQDAVNRWLTPEQRADLHAEAHTAMGDVRWSTRVLAAQLHAVAKLPRDLQQLHDLCSPGWFDAEGKLQWKNGVLCLSFGDHRDKPLASVPSSYLTWMITKDFSTKVKDACRDALHGIYPTAPATGPAEDE